MESKSVAPTLQEQKTQEKKYAAQMAREQALSSLTRSAVWEHFGVILSTKFRGDSLENPPE